MLLLILGFTFTSADDLTNVKKIIFYCNLQKGVFLCKKQSKTIKYKEKIMLSKCM